MIKHLQWDTDFFGYPVALIELPSENIEELLADVETIKSDGYKLVYIKVDPSDEIINKQIVQAGAVLYDEKLTFRKSVSYSEIEDSNIFLCKYDFPNDDMYNIAIQTGEYSRYKIDSKITTTQFENLYKIWINNSVQKINANEVFIYLLEGKVIGLVTVVLEDIEGKIGLIGVDFKFRGFKIGSKLIKMVENYLLERNINILSVVTQKKNIPACKFYESSGFELISMENIYHLWI